MKIEEFNSKKIKAGDWLDIQYTDGTNSRSLLFKDTVYMGVEERVEYRTGNIIPAIPPRIIVQGKTGEQMEKGIHLTDIEEIDFYKSFN